MVGPDDGIGTLQVLRGSPSHPVTVVTTQKHDDKSPRLPQGWRVCGVVHTVLLFLHVLPIDSYLYQDARMHLSSNLKAVI